MQIHNVEQRTPEWFALKVGLPSGSSFSEIITPVEGKPVDIKVSTRLINKLALERVTGEVESSGYDNEHMKRGRELEPEAIAWYEFMYDKIVEPIGFITNHGLGFSPDGFVKDEKGFIEIKSVCAKVQLECLEAGSVMPRTHYPQVQGGLYVTGYDYCDFISYNKTFPSFCVRVFRDEEYIAKLEAESKNVLRKIEHRVQEMQKWLK